MLNRLITVYLHMGDTFMPKGFSALPRVGEIIDLGPRGRWTVVRVEYDEAGDSHLHLGEMPPSNPGAG